MKGSEKYLREIGASSILVAAFDKIGKNGDLTKDWVLSCGKYWILPLLSRYKKPTWDHHSEKCIYSKSGLLQHLEAVA